MLSKYPFSTYCTKKRINSFWHQCDEIFAVDFFVFKNRELGGGI